MNVALNNISSLKYGPVILKTFNVSEKKNLVNQGKTEMLQDTGIFQ